MQSNIISSIALNRSCFALLQHAYKCVEPVRMFRCIGCLNKAGQILIPLNPIEKAFSKQNKDGGWCDVEESAWALNIAVQSHDFLISKICQLGITWIVNERTEHGAWGKTCRDIPRIPTTCLVLILLPELSDNLVLTWLEHEWKEELSFDTKLTYKGALTLKAFNSVGVSPKDPYLIENTVAYLCQEQNKDGGFAPWKNHPIGSEPWSTGIALIGLSAWPDLVDHEVLVKALDWLGRNQLPNGLWPCHYIEEGSAYCYWGAVEALKVLKKAGHPCAV